VDTSWAQNAPKESAMSRIGILQSLRREPALDCRDGRTDQEDRQGIGRRREDVHGWRTAARPEPREPLTEDGRMSRRGNCIDNAPTESFFRIYNRERLHSRWGYRSPVDSEQQAIVAQEQLIILTCVRGDGSRPVHFVLSVGSVTPLLRVDPVAPSAPCLVGSSSSRSRRCRKRS